MKRRAISLSTTAVAMDAEREEGRMREGPGVLALVSAMALAVFLFACSGDDSGRISGGKAVRGGGQAPRRVENELGHQAFQPSTRLVVPAEEGDVPDLAARVLAGLAEGPLGVRVFVDRRPGEGGLVAWRDVADEEPEGHQLAYVTEGLLASEGEGSGEVGPGDFEMVAQTDSGFAVLVAKGDPEVETLQWEDFEDLGDFVDAAAEDPGLVEVADAGADSVYRAGTLALEREAGIDLSPKSPANKTPVQAIYDSDVEAALVPVDREVLADVLAGELQVLAVLGKERCPDLPKVPTAKERGYDVSVPVFGGIAAPKGTPDDVVEELGRAFVAGSSSREFGRVLVGTGREPAQRGPEKFADFVDEQARDSSEAEAESGEGG
jgi:tripartite-type tricarboxylate transporter receptor subunit TctC